MTQRELAPLVMVRHPTHLSRIERGLRDPSVPCVFASCVVFGVNVEHLFPGLREQVRDQVVRNAYKLYRKVEADGRQQSMKKRELLRAVATRNFLPCE